MRSVAFLRLAFMMFFILPNAEAIFGWGKRKRNKKKDGRNRPVSINNNGNSINKNRIRRLEEFLDQVREENLERFKSENCLSSEKLFDRAATFFTPKSVLVGGAAIDTALYDRCIGVQKKFGYVSNVEFDIESFDAQGLVFFGTMTETIYGSLQNSSIDLRYTYILKETQGGDLKIIHRHDSTPA